MIWVLTLRRVILADGGNRLVVYRDQGVADDPRVVAVVRVGPQCAGKHRHQMVKHAVDGRLAGVEQGSLRAGGQVGAQVDQHQQRPYRQ
jgi:hypothetical protein